MVIHLAEEGAQKGLTMTRIETTVVVLTQPGQGKDLELVTNILLLGVMEFYLSG